MTMAFLDEFLKNPIKGEIATDPLPKAERDVMALDSVYFDADVCDDHDHSGDEKIGSCGKSCAGCPSKGTDACDDHSH